MNDLSSSATRPEACFNITGRISDNPAIREVKVVFACSLEQHSWPRFSARAIDLEIMSAAINARNGCAYIAEFFAHSFVNFV